MNKNTILFIAFLILAGATAWYFFQGNKTQSSTLKGSDRNFATEDISQINKIFMADRRGRTKTLERQGDHWVYNEKYRASENVMKNLLEVLKKVELQFIPPRSAIDPIVKDLAANGIKVELYDASNQLLKAFYVGGTTPDERGTYMIMEGAEQPYVMELPTMEGGLRVRFDIWGDDFRDKSMFRYNLEDITFVSVEYPNERNKSFKLYAENGKYEVEPFYAITPGSRQEIQKGVAQSYLLGYELLYAESFQNDNKDIPEYLEQIPFANITIQTRDQEETTYRLFPMVSTYATGDIASPEIERYYVEVLPEKDYLLAQNQLVKKVLWPLESFIGTSGNTEG